MKKLLEFGLVHSDYNEFNILADNDEKVYMIDFPQTVSVNHPDAEYFFKRDLDCL